MALPGRDGKAGSPIEQESTRRTGYRERCLYPAELDAWQAQVLGRVLERAELWVHSEGVADDVLRTAGMVPVHDPTAAVADAVRRRGRGARVCVLPQGPLTVATPSGEA